MERRRFIELAGALGIAPWVRMDETPVVITRAIPSSGEKIPIIGMGTWQTFDVGRSSDARTPLLDVLRIFFARGGRLIDSSPMYGRSELVVGDLISQMNPHPPLFSATKVWTPGRRLGVMQMYASFDLWRVKKFDLLQVHNLLDWQGHLQTLKEWKASGRVRYIGVTTSHGRRHEELERLMLREPLDFVQFTYNLADRSAESRLLPLARERGMAVILNRPLDGGNLFDRVRGKALPSWAAEFDCTTWSQFFLKFVVSHPSVTCAIPATSQPSHMTENIGALVGRLPDPPMRARMITYFASL
jgi:diketogulonate reductase-like aldo/keto reductase